MSLRLRDDYLQILIDWIVRARRAAAGRVDLDFEVLSPPHRNSPFLTLAEHPGAARSGLPWRVVKLLLVLDDDPGEPVWQGILSYERDRWRNALRRRLRPPKRVATLGLPLSAPLDRLEELVEIAEIGPVQRRDLLAGAPAEGSLRLSYLVRPFIAWPHLRSVGTSADQLQERWQTWVEDHDVARHLREPLFEHFCDEALTNGRGDLLLTSAWRLEFLR